jgi:hypothetical protein
MRTRSSPGVQDRWRDSEGTRIALFARVEQVIKDTEPTMLRARLHQRDQVVGRGLEGLYVCFPGNQVISLRPESVRVLGRTECGDGRDLCC